MLSPGNCAGMPGPLGAAARRTATCGVRAARAGAAWASSAAAAASAMRRSGRAGRYGPRRRTAMGARSALQDRGVVGGDPRAGGRVEVAHDEQAQRDAGPAGEVLVPGAVVLHRALDDARVGADRRARPPGRVEP